MIEDARKARGCVSSLEKARSSEGTDRPTQVRCEKAYHPKKPYGAGGVFSHSISIKTFQTTARTGHATKNTIKL